MLGCDTQRQKGWTEKGGADGSCLSRGYTYLLDGAYVVRVEPTALEQRLIRPSARPVQHLSHPPIVISREVSRESCGTLHDHGATAQARHLYTACFGMRAHSL